MSSVCSRWEKKSGLGGKTKWDLKSISRVCLGSSPIHASNVALFFESLDCTREPSASPWFLWWFLTVSHLHSNNTQPPNWIDLIKNRSCNHDTFETNLQDTWFIKDDDEHNASGETRDAIKKTVRFYLTLDIEDDSGREGMRELPRTSEVEETREVRSQENPNDFVNTETLVL